MLKYQEKLIKKIYKVRFIKFRNIKNRNHHETEI